MYSLSDYGRMMADAARMSVFTQALARSIRPDSVVVDIGTGAGIFALLACQLGARRVYAIEPDDVIQVARELAAANGYDDRIQFVQALSTAVSLPERADVIVSDIGGALPWFRRHIPSVVDARQRFLAPDGVLIPARDIGWAALIEAPEVYRSLTAGWDEDRFGLKLGAARQLVINSRTTCHITRDHLLAPPQRWAPLDYYHVEDSDMRAVLEFHASRTGTAHGFAAGFDRVVGDGLQLSNAPDAPPTIDAAEIYGTMFFPWPQPVALEAGEGVSLEITAHLVGDDYVWRWRTVIRRGAKPEDAVAFDQSTFAGVPLSPAQLGKRAETYVPQLGEDGKLLVMALELMRNRIALGEIADQLQQAFPKRFTQRRDAVNFAADLSRQYG